LSSDVDIYRSAYLLILQHGLDAGRHAAEKADEFYVVGDLQSYVVWRRIVQAVEKLKSLKSSKGALAQ
jgi:hypothetical protein